jgi:hypothetical protein
MSEYIGQSGVVFSRSPIAVNTVEADCKDFYAEIWSVTGLGGRQYGTTYGDEWDLWVGWSHTFGNVKITASCAYFALAQLDKVNDDMWIAEQEISLPKSPYVQPYLHSRYYGSVDDAWKPGWLLYGGLRKSIEFGHSFSDRPYSLNLDASTAYNINALHDFSGFIYGGITVSLDIPLSKHATLSPCLIYQKAVPGEEADPNGFMTNDNLVCGLTFKWTF